MWVCYNDNIQQMPLLPADNRSFRYGDGCFESMAMFGSEIPLLPFHLSRLSQTASLLQLPLPPSLCQIEHAQKLVYQLAQANGCSNARLRLSVVRQGSGLYTPPAADTPADCLWEMKPSLHTQFIWQPEGLTLGIYTEHLKPTTPLSNYKTNNALLFVLASIYKQKHEYDECLLLNTRGEIAEATAANVFAVLPDNTIITPPLSAGCVAGVMRKQIFIIARQLGLTLIEAPISTTQLSSFKELFLTNATQGIRSVCKIEDIDYFSNTTSYAIHEKLINTCVKV